MLPRLPPGSSESDTFPPSKAPPHLQQLLSRALTPLLQLQDVAREFAALLPQFGLAVPQPLQSLLFLSLQSPQVRLLLLPQEPLQSLEVRLDFLSRNVYLLLESRTSAQKVETTQQSIHG